MLSYRFPSRFVNVPTETLGKYLEETVPLIVVSDVEIDVELFGPLRLSWIDAADLTGLELNEWEKEFRRMCWS